jgi:hypothetical protein
VEEEHVSREREGEESRQKKDEFSLKRKCEVSPVIPITEKGRESCMACGMNVKTS